MSEDNELIASKLLFFSMIFGYCVTFEVDISNAEIPDGNYIVLMNGSWNGWNWGYELTETDKVEIFSKKHIYTWINCVIIGFGLMFSLKLYLENYRKIGIGKSEVLKESIHIIIIFILSYLILGNKDINFEIIIGIIIIIFGMYLIQKNDKIII